MHTLRVLHDLLRQCASSIHATRLKAVLAAAQSLTTSAQAMVTSLGRGLMRPVDAKHKIKRIDRLYTAGKVAGFLLHAGVAARAHERKKLKRLCRYISRSGFRKSGYR